MARSLAVNWPEEMERVGRMVSNEWLEVGKHNQQTRRSTAKGGGGEGGEGRYREAEAGVSVTMRTDDSRVGQGP
jgi:hypothetical protein